MTNGRRLVLAFTFKLGQKQAQLRSAMETVKICSKCVGSTINAGSGFHGSSVLRLLVLRIYPTLILIILYPLHFLGSRNFGQLWIDLGQPSLKNRANGQPHEKIKPHSRLKPVNHLVFCDASPSYSS